MTVTCIRGDQLRSADKRWVLETFTKRYTADFMPMHVRLGMGAYQRHHPVEFAYPRFDAATDAQWLRTRFFHVKSDRRVDRRYRTFETRARP